MKIYICGPTNQELVLTLELFETWEERLKEDLKHIPNIEIINPTKIGTHLPWGDYVSERINAMKSCDTVLVLRAFTNSSIASDEFDLAVKMGKHVVLQHHYNELLEHCEAGIVLKN